MESEPHEMKPYLTGRMDLGHILQAVVILLTVGGGLIANYIATQASILAVQSNVSNQALQISDLYKRLEQMQADQRGLSKDIAGNLTKMSDQLGDLRVLVARGLDGHK